MFIHEMSEAECRQYLEQTSVGRLACARDDQPYVVPIHFALEGMYLYGFTTLGQKIEWMRSNPFVCFETDELDTNEWTSIVIFGRYEELTDTPEHETARQIAHGLLQKRAMWWEPAYIAQTHRDQPHSLTPIFYRIQIEKMTGHRATAEASDTVPPNMKGSTAKRGWLDKLLHPS